MPADAVTDTRATADAAASAVAAATGVDRHDVALIMGSGWAPAAERLGTPTADIEVASLPGFTPPTVQGHSGRMLSVPIGGKQALVLLGRTHLYEGRGVGPVVHGIRTAVAAGARIIADLATEGAAAAPVGSVIQQQTPAAWGLPGTVRGR